MSDIPQIFDQSLRRRRKQRCASRFQSSSFLHEAVARELGDRIGAIKRHFETFVCHGLPGLSQLVANHALETGIASSRTTQAVFDESALPFASRSLDAYASVLTLHAINDLPGALSQIRRALKPDGLFIAALFGSNTLRELRECLSQAELEVDGGISPRVFPFADIRDAGALLQRAGFALPVADSDLVTVHYEHALKLLHDLRNMGETNALLERRKTPLKRRTLFRAMELYGERFSDRDGRVIASFEVLYLAGWAPHASQQQPLKPGSGKINLAEALKRPGPERN